jgi:hypothetical protein
MCLGGGHPHQAKIFVAEFAFGHSSSGGVAGHTFILGEIL